MAAQSLPHRAGQSLGFLGILPALPSLCSPPMGEGWLCSQKTQVRISALFLSSHNLNVVEVSHPLGVCRSLT